MRVEVKETASILVKARKGDVLDVLQRVVKDGSLVTPDRLVGRGSTYVLRDAPDGTQVFHMRSGSAAVPVASRERESLRREVQADLFELQRLFEVKER